MLPKNILCFSSVPWDFKMRRPQQLLIRFAEQANVYFFEEPVFDAQNDCFITFSTRSETLWKVVPHVLPNLSREQISTCMEQLLDDFFKKANLDNWTFWYYTKNAFSFSKKYKPKLTIYDSIAGYDEGHSSDWDEIFTAIHSKIKSQLSSVNIIDLCN